MRGKTESKRQIRQKNWGESPSLTQSLVDRNDGSSSDGRRLGFVGDQLAQERNQDNERVGVIAEKSPAISDARPVMSIQLAIITP